MSSSRCPLCGVPAQKLFSLGPDGTPRAAYDVTCRACGTYEITFELESRLGSQSPENQRTKALLSIATRAAFDKGDRLALHAKSYEQHVAKHQNISYRNREDKLLEILYARQSPDAPYDAVAFSPADDWPAALTVSPKACQGLLDDLVQQGYINPSRDADGKATYALLAKGRQRVEEGKIRLSEVKAAPRKTVDEIELCPDDRNGTLAVWLKNNGSESAMCELTLSGLRQLMPDRRQYRQRDCQRIKLIPLREIGAGEETKTACTLARLHGNRLVAEPSGGGPYALDATESGTYEVTFEIGFGELTRREARYFLWTAGKALKYLDCPPELASDASQGSASSRPENVDAKRPSEGVDASSTESIKVFISYSHDSPVHKENVSAFAKKLRADGIDATIDQHVDAPPNGWPMWMESQIRRATFVLLVCTETYLRRVQNEEKPGSGSGVLWEATIIYNSIYPPADARKFIPVLFAEGKTDWIPLPLRGFTHYQIRGEDDYDFLYRRLTNQPAHILEPVGQVRKMPPAQQPGGFLLPPQIPDNVPQSITRSPRAFIVKHNPQVLLWPTVVSASWLQQTATITLRPDEAGDAAELDKLDGAPDPIVLACQHHVTLAHVREKTHRYEKGEDLFDFTLAIKKHVGINLFTDVAFMPDGDPEHLSVVELANIRARRLLLNDNPTPTVVAPGEELREACIQGVSADHKVKGSPFPVLHRLYGDRPQFFLECAWITALAYLHLSHVVDAVEELKLTLVSTKSLEVTFAGMRGASRITVNGVCALP